MGAIYAHAELTTISLGASEADELPGVSDVARRPQATYTSPSGTAYLGTGQSMRTAMARSKWMTRGWCYQELLLSRRVLICADQQAHLMCNTIGTSEALAHPFGLTDHSDTTSIRWFQEDEYIDSPWEFGSWLTAFTSQGLSYQSDALSAFRGVLNTSLHSS